MSPLFDDWDEPNIVLPNGNEKVWNPKQLEIQFFWPLREQIPLDLDYTDCEKPKLSLTTPYSTGSTIAYNGAAWNTTAPQITIEPNNPSGYIKIGGMNIGLEKKPNILQRVLHKLLGFDWKDK